MKAVLEDLPLRPTVGAGADLGPGAAGAAGRLARARRARGRPCSTSLARDHASIVETLANGMQTPIWDVRPDTAQPLIDVIMGDSRVTAVSVTAPVFPQSLEAAKAGGAGRGHGRARAPRAARWPSDRHRPGRDDHGTARAEAARQGWQAMLTALFQMAFGLLLIFPLIRLKVLAPLGRLVGQSQELAAGRLDQPFSWRRKDELGALGRSFEHTRRSLQALFRDLEQRNGELRAARGRPRPSDPGPARDPRQHDRRHQPDRPRAPAGRLERPVPRDLRPAAATRCTRGSRSCDAPPGLGRAQRVSRRRRRSP